MCPSPLCGIAVTQFVSASDWPASSRPASIRSSTALSQSSTGFSSMSSIATLRYGSWESFNKSAFLTYSRFAKIDFHYHVNNFGNQVAGETLNVNRTLRTTFLTAAGQRKRVIPSTRLPSSFHFTVPLLSPGQGSAIRVVFLNPDPSEAVFLNL